MRTTANLRKPQVNVDVIPANPERGPMAYIDIRDDMDVITLGSLDPRALLAVATACTEAAERLQALNDGATWNKASVA